MSIAGITKAILRGTGASGSLAKRILILRKLSTMLKGSVEQGVVDALDRNALIEGIDYKRNRILCNAPLLGIYDYHTLELISEASITLDGFNPHKLFIDKKRDELIVIYLDDKYNSAVAIYNLDDFSKRHDFCSFAKGSSLTIVVDFTGQHFLNFLPRYPILSQNRIFCAMSLKPI